MTNYIDGHTGEELDDFDLHERYDEWLDEIYPEVEMGHSVFQPSEILKELEPITYRVGFSDFLDSMTEDNSIIDMDNAPECEECGEELSTNEVTECISEYNGEMICVECFNADEDEDDTDE